MMEEEKSYGVKVSILNEVDYKDFKEICDAIESKGFSIKIIDNGNAVCTKEGGVD